MATSLKRLLIGSPLESARLQHEKLPKWKALAVFSSDALSSVAYATEEILLTLAVIGTSIFFYSIHITLAILVLLFLVTLSYRQIISAFPSGGGAYVVSREHIGPTTSLVAGSALMIDYILTVAVSICSGVAAITSAFPALLEHKVLISVALVIVVMLLNLRGVTESATIFAYPTYIFMFSVLLTVIVGGFKLYTEGWHGFNTTNHAETDQLFTTYGMYILLRAFSSGCSAMTGVEAISNGVPSFKTDSVKNSRITMVWMSSLLGFMFIGISTLATGFGVQALDHVTVMSQISSHVFGGSSLMYYIFQWSTMLILVLAANTAFAGFPQLASIIASDGYMPRNLAARGDRLVFSNGIILLGTLAIILIILFKGETHALIPLYAVGVFLSFTLAQAGLVKKLWIEPTRKWGVILLVIMGAIVTGTVTLITVVAKFTQGAWLVVVAIPLVIIVFYKIHKHYQQVGRQLRVDDSEETMKNAIHAAAKVIIPISSVSKVVIDSVRYARSISDDITAITIVFNEEEEQRIRTSWDRFYPEVELKVVYSHYRTILHPLLDYISEIENTTPSTSITVVMPQFVVKKTWHTLLHNQTGIVIRFALLRKKKVAIATIPFHLKE